MNSNKCKNLRNEKGFITVLLAAGVMFLLIVFVGFAVDLGYMYVVKGQLQNAADAGALAGAAILLPTDSTSIDPAKVRAKQIAESNNVGEYHPFTNGIALDTSNNLTSSNDIVVGFWNGTSFTPDLTNYNAIEVCARRTADSPLLQVGLFFSKILGWERMSTGACAIADLAPAPLLPIAVNEYWLGVPPGGGGGGGNGKGGGGGDNRPYGALQNYPHSFVRQINVDGTLNTGVNGNYGLPFAILGANANDNIPQSVAKGSRNMNGFVDLDVRASRHDGASYPDGTPSWYVVSGPSLMPGCIGGFTGPTTDNSGFVSSEKFDASLQYLFNIYPNNYPMPTAVKEQYVGDYPTGSGAKYLYPATPPLSPTTSSAPYATIAYFSSSGDQPLNQKINGQYFSDAYTANKKIVAMVYDGTFDSQSDPSAPNAVTNVGYVLLQIDGYSSTTPNQMLSSSKKDFLSTSGNTVYAHALAPILEPSALGPGGCDAAFWAALNALMYSGGTAKLVK